MAGWKIHEMNEGFHMGKSSINGGFSIYFEVLSPFSILGLEARDEHPQPTRSALALVQHGTFERNVS